MDTNGACNIQKRLNILLLPDHLDSWAAHNRCKAIQKFIPEHDFKIVDGYYGYKQVAEYIENFDLVHLNFTADAHIYYDLVMKYDRKFIITIINERSILNGYLLDKPKFDEMIGRCAYATSLSEKIAKFYNIEWIPNGVDFSIFNNPKDIVIGYAGTSSENKGVKYLKEACDILGLTLVTRFYGEEQISHEEMQNFYRNIDVFVHVSETEGCSNTVLEALAMNVPVIKTRTGIWDKYEGYVTYIDNNTASVVEALKRFKSRNLIEREFRWEFITRKYKEIYEGAVSGTLRRKQ